MKKLLWKILRHFHKPAVFEKKDIKNILVIRMNKIGDMICTIPLLKTIKKEFPAASLNLLAENTNAEVIKNASYIDRLLVYRKGSGIHKSRLLNIRHLLGDNFFDLAIGVKAGFSSNLSITTYLSNARYRVGYISSNHHPAELFYNIPAQKEPVIQHQVEQCLNLLKPLGITPDRFIRDISFEIPGTALARFRNFIGSDTIDKKTVVVNISNDRPDTTWAIENFRFLIKRLGENRIDCIVTSAPGDSEKAKELAAKCSVLFYDTPHIMDFAAAVKNSALLISHDSGAMHIGASVGTKTLVLVGRSIIPEVWGPYGDGHRCILKTKIQDIVVDDVVKETLEMLKNKK